MALSIDESLQKLKAEILSQDWRLTPRRIEPLEEAFGCLKQRFKTRKNVLAILTMADSVLQHLKKREDDPPPAFIDFLKEAMAHVVNIYEDGRFDPEREEGLFKRVYSQFTVLKQLVQEGKKAGATGSAATPPPGETPPAPDGHDTEEILPAIEATTPMTPLPAAASLQPTASTDIVGKGPKIYAPPAGTAFRPIAIGEVCLAIEEEAIAFISTLRPGKRKAYIKTSHIPLKDFAPLFGSLAKLLHGPLAAIKSSKLKKLELPLMTPQGLGLPAIPDENARFLLIVSSGQWHGVLLCSEVQEELRLLNTFHKAKNGDIAGTGFMDDESSLPLLNPGLLVEREGFLAAVDRNFLNSV